MTPAVTALFLSLLLLLQSQRLAPYAPTPHDVVDRMLTLAAVTRDDILIDLGCGDGRIPIRAASRFGIRAVGVDIDPRRIAESRENARAAGVEHLTEFRVEDALTTRLAGATVVTLFIGSDGNSRLRPNLQQQLAPGARVVSHAFSMGAAWPADVVDRFTSADGDQVTLYLWTIGRKKLPAFSSQLSVPAPSFQLPPPGLGRPASDSTPQRHPEAES